MEPFEERYLSIQVPKELLDYIDRRIEQAVTNAIGGTPAEPSKPIYYTRRDICQLLKISLPTVDRYIRHGIISGSKVGNRIVISQANLDAALTKINGRRGKTEPSAGVRPPRGFRIPVEANNSTTSKS